MFAKGETLSGWRELVGRRLLNLDFKPLSDEPFRASVEPVFEHTGLRVTRMSLSPGLTIRDDNLVKDGSDAFVLVISKSSTLESAQQGREIRLGRGEATLMRASEPGTVGSAKSFSLVAVMIPRAELQSREFRDDQLFMQRWPRSSEALVLLKVYLSCLEKKPVERSAEVRAAVRRHVLDLVALAATDPVRSGREPEIGAVLAARLQAALKYITTRFWDPALSLSSVATSQRISTRYLQRLFEKANLRFTEHVNELRLQKAYQCLTDPRLVSQHVADIALESGFSDVSHFNRLFRRRFDATPTAVRLLATRTGPTDCHYNLALLYEELKNPKDAICYMAQYRRLIGARSE